MFIVEPQEKEVINFRGSDYTIEEMSLSDSFKMQTLLKKMETEPDNAIADLSVFLTPYMGGLAEKFTEMTAREFMKVIEYYGSFVSGSGKANS